MHTSGFTKIEICQPKLTHCYKQIYPYPCSLVSFILASMFFILKSKSLAPTSLSDTLSLIAKPKNSHLLTQLAVYEGNKEAN